MSIVAEERLRDFLGRRRTFFFNVAPRYTSGSPAMVTEETALRVAAQEQRSYQHALEGIYGPDEQSKAMSKGLNGIAECVVETRQGWDTLNLITGERYVRPFDKQ